MEYIIDKNNVDRLIFLILNEIETDKIELSHLNNLIHLISWEYCKTYTIDRKSALSYMIINIPWNYKLTKNAEHLQEIYNSNKNIEVFQKINKKYVKLLKNNNDILFDEKSILIIIKKVLSYELINFRSEYYIYQTYPFETVKYWELNEEIDFLKKIKESKISFYNFISYL